MKSLSHKQWGLLAGCSLILMAIAAGYSFGYVFGELIVSDDSVSTQNRINAAPGLYLSGVVGWILIFLLDLIVTWALYRYFQRVSKPGSALTAILRLAYTLVLGLAITYLLSGYSSPVEASVEDLPDFTGSFERVWSNGLILFGFHLTGLGWLAWKNRRIPNIWSILLILGGMSYVLIHSGRLFPELAETIASLETVLAIPMTVGELGFGIWLIVDGFRRTKPRISPE